MKIYNNINATFTMQDYGSAWLIIMRGTQQEIEWLFNGFFNHGAVDTSEIKWNDLDDTALFWTNKEKMGKFFWNLALHRKLNQGHADNKSTSNAAYLIGESMLKDLYNNHRESRNMYHYGSENYYQYNIGKISAESPDLDMKDAIINHAYAEKEESLVKSAELK